MRRAILALVIVVFLALTVVAASCTSDQATTTSAVTPSTSTSDSPATSSTVSPVTELWHDLDLTWSPVTPLSASDRQTVSEGLRARGFRMLFPKDVPVGDAASYKSEFTIWRTVPTNVITAEFVFWRNRDSEFLVYLWSGHGHLPSHTAAYERVGVRDQEGRSTESTTGSADVYWEEAGQVFRARSSLLSLEQLTGWLESWEIIP
ncbi:MAG: hypothetical protein JXA87_04385 [Thermoleophilia bacterium]|nr:hypothetical protein [Thermoleophilia bacterium]